MGEDIPETLASTGKQEHPIQEDKNLLKPLWLQPKLSDPGGFTNRSRCDIIKSKGEGGISHEGSHQGHSHQPQRTRLEFGDHGQKGPEDAEEGPFHPSRPGQGKEMGAHGHRG